MSLRLESRQEVAARTRASRAEHGGVLVALQSRGACGSVRRVLGVASVDLMPFDSARIGRPRPLAAVATSRACYLRHTFTHFRRIVVNTRYSGSVAAGLENQLKSFGLP